LISVSSSAARSPRGSITNRPKVEHRYAAWALADGVEQFRIERLHPVVDEVRFDPKVADRVRGLLQPAIACCVVSSRRGVWGHANAGGKVVATDDADTAQPSGATGQTRAMSDDARRQDGDAIERKLGWMDMFVGRADDPRNFAPSVVELATLFRLPHRVPPDA
jgi:hypothetical protein